MTQVQKARNGIFTFEMEFISKSEGISKERLLQLLSEGKLILPRNNQRELKNFKAIGSGTTVKVNANLGTSATHGSIESELEKLRTSLKFGADTVMDLSTGLMIEETRATLLKECPIPFGTVPIYQVVKDLKGDETFRPEDLLDMIEHQAKQGVDFMTLHCGILREHLTWLDQRLLKIVSRGGGILARWMVKTGDQNPLYTEFDHLLDILEKYDVTLSLGDALRPGALCDSSDRAQLSELQTLGELTKRALKRGVQVMVEGPGHIPLDEIEFNVALQKKSCLGVPFFVLGPLVTDLAAGYDHISGAIGGAVAGWFGADLLCYVTPKEHLGLPDRTDVEEGLIAFKIAAHAANVVRHPQQSRNLDDQMSKARRDFDWSKQMALSFNPDRAQAFHDQTLSASSFKNAHFCSMCGPQYCPLREESRT